MELFVQERLWNDERIDFIIIHMEIIGEYLRYMYCALSQLCLGYRLDFYKKERCGLLSFFTMKTECVMMKLSVRTCQ